jgi:hypothetical protein
VETLACKQCGCWFHDDDFDGEADDYVCGSCRMEHLEALRYDAHRARRKGE